MTKNDINKVVKEFLDRLNTILEYDESIKVNSVDKLVDKANKYLKEEQ